MANPLKQFIRNLLPEQVSSALLAGRNERKRQAAYKTWREQGSPVPPPHEVKELIIEEICRNYPHKIFIETGTFMGDMIYSQRNNFDRLYSVELSEALWQKAMKRFSSMAHVHILYGDSGKVMGDLIQEIHEPAVFWLDGHYSDGITARGEKDCPVLEELAAIFSSPVKDHLILIDDARCFTKEQNFPTLDEVRAFLSGYGKHMEIQDDIIRIS